MADRYYFVLMRNGHHQVFFSAVLDTYEQAERIGEFLDEECKRHKGEHALYAESEMMQENVGHYCMPLVRLAVEWSDFEKRVQTLEDSSDEDEDFEEELGYGGFALYELYTAAKKSAAAVRKIGRFTNLDEDGATPIPRHFFCWDTGSGEPEVFSVLEVERPEDVDALSYALEKQCYTFGGAFSWYSDMELVEENPGLLLILEQQWDLWQADMEDADEEKSEHDEDRLHLCQLSKEWLRDLDAARKRAVEACYRDGDDFSPDDVRQMGQTLYGILTLLISGARKCLATGGEWPFPLNHAAMKRFIYAIIDQFPSGFTPANVAKDAPIKFEFNGGDLAIRELLGAIAAPEQCFDDNPDTPYIYSALAAAEETLADLPELCGFERWEWSESNGENQRAGIDESMLETAASPKPTDTVLFVPSPLQSEILKALDGKAMRKQQLADKVCGGNGSRLYRKNGLKELQNYGKVEHQDGVGYFRPDAPPPNSIKVSTATKKPLDRDH